MRFHHQIIGSRMNILMLRSRRKLEETNRQLTGDEMKNETKHYVEYLNHNPNWLKKISIEIDKFLINHEYIDFFIQIYMQWIKDDGSTSYFQTLIFPRLPCFEKLAKFKVYIETETTTHFLCAVISKRLF